MPGNLKKKSAIIIYFKLVDVMNIIAKGLGGILLCLISITVFLSVVSRTCYICDGLVVYIGRRHCYQTWGYDFSNNYS